MSSSHRCVEETENYNITVKEKGRKANFQNLDRSKFQKIKVDNCLITDSSVVRSDWIIRKIGVGSVIVELKGKDVSHACAQLFSTLTHEACQQWLEARKAFLIVCSRYPKFDSIVSRNQEAARQRGIRLKIVCDQGNFKIEELLGLATQPAAVIAQPNGNQSVRQNRAPRNNKAQQKT